MSGITLQYIPYNTDVAFLGIKQQEIGLLHYRIAFFTHVYTALFVLPAGFIQFSPFLLKHFKKLHRLSGWIYTGFVLILVAPSGFVMGLYANGGPTSQISFCLLALLWFYSTLMAIVSIRKKDITGHRKWMIRSFALTLSAISLRAWKYILVYLFHPAPMDNYRMVAWLSWVVNLLIAEIIIFKFIHHAKNNHRPAVTQSAGRL
ncbi:MAG: DUF2306 domain-containing protein [Chitinophagaceae bacterium]|nr:DUF2306 domain-containing protein [Chitinophagaceae bacterium]